MVKDRCVAKGDNYIHKELCYAKMRFGVLDVAQFAWGIAKRA